MRKFLPCEYPNLQYEGQLTTIHGLVTHTLGSETPPKLDSVFTEIFAGNYVDMPRNDGMKDLFSELETVQLDHMPGTFYDYNNVGPD